MSYADHQSPIVRFGRGIAVFILLIGGPISGYFLIGILFQARATANWPSTTGTITMAEVRDVGMNRYVADVAYTYRVGGTDFIGSKISTSDGEYNIRDGAVQRLGALAKGQMVLVFYNPSNPGQAVLRPGAKFQDYGVLLVPILMFSVGVWLFRFLWRTRRQAR